MLKGESAATWAWCVVARSAYEEEMMYCQFYMLRGTEYKAAVWSGELAQDQQIAHYSLVRRCHRVAAHNFLQEHSIFPSRISTNTIYLRI